MDRRQFIKIASITPDDSLTVEKLMKIKDRLEKIPEPTHYILLGATTPCEIWAENGGLESKPVTIREYCK